MKGSEVQEGPAETFNCICKNRKNCVRVEWAKRKLYSEQVTVRPGYTRLSWLFNVCMTREYEEKLNLPLENQNSIN